jgi:F-type H+-transporting ATPase subunit delta
VKNLAIARRYAKALILIGKEDGQTENYRKEIGKIADIFGREKQFSDLLSNPLYKLEERRRVLENTIAKLGLSKAMNSFLRLLFEKGRIGFIVAINDFYQKLADELNGVARATLVSAAELSGGAVEKIRAALSKRTGKDVILEVQQDPGLIGGIVTRIGDLVLDGSIKTQLLNMRESLRRGEGA